MVKVVATSKGYFGGEIREIGASFVVPDDIWRDDKRRPSWAKLDARSAFGGKGDHDGDGSVGGSKPGAPGSVKADAMGSTVLTPPGSAGGNAGGDEPLIVPADWGSLPAPERKALASKISGGEVKKAPDADKIIAEYVEATKPTPFSDAPPPETVTKPAGNGITEALGGPAPDWIAHDPAGDPAPSGDPQPVDD
jgi:hypothetical protein